jgi:hypothetical protein
MFGHYLLWPNIAKKVAQSSFPRSHVFPWSHAAEHTVLPNAQRDHSRNSDQQLRFGTQPCSSNHKVLAAVGTELGRPFFCCANYTAQTAEPVEKELGRITENLPGKNFRVIFPLLGNFRRKGNSGKFRIFPRNREIEGTLPIFQKLRKHSSKFQSKKRIF